MTADASRASGANRQPQRDPVAALGQFIAAPPRWLLRVTRGWHLVARIPIVIVALPIAMVASAFIAVTAFFVLVLGAMRIGPGLATFSEHWEKARTRRTS
jgi:hypothetical protein